MENDILIHELTHGISNRMTGGGSANCLSASFEAKGLGEGWSDAFAEYVFTFLLPPGRVPQQMDLAAGCPKNQERSKISPLGHTLLVNPRVYGRRCTQHRGEPPLRCPFSPTHTSDRFFLGRSTTSPIDMPDSTFTMYTVRPSSFPPSVPVLPLLPSTFSYQQL